MIWPQADGARLVFSRKQMRHVACAFSSTQSNPMITKSVRTTSHERERRVVVRAPFRAALVVLALLPLSLVPDTTAAGPLTAVVAAHVYTCGLTTGGGVVCWGDGLLGNGTWSTQTTPVAVAGLTSGVRALSAAFDHTCALMEDGTVRCWGSNWHGPLGDGTTETRYTPVTVPGLHDAIAISAGSHHTCAVTAGGSVQCWGSNSDGQLGDGTTTDRLAPVSVVGLPSPAQSVAAGSAHTCALMTNGGVQCWGDNYFAELGDGTTVSRRTPAPVTGLSSGVASISTGGSRNCAVTVAGDVLCWGRYPPDGHLTPEVVDGLPGPVSLVATGEWRTCAFTRAGNSYCWGDNSDGALGDGTLINRNSPVAVNALESVISIAVGSFHSCAVTTAGIGKCWGNNQWGQIGDGTTDFQTVPAAVIGLSSGVKALSAGSTNTCALTAASAVQCWGGNEQGQVGDGTTFQRVVPTTVSGLSDGATAVTTGQLHSCALTVTGTVRCWGNNRLGQLGDGTTENRVVPVTVPGLSSVISISAGSDHTCAVLSGGSLRCWGGNSDGQLGDGTTTDRSTPVAVYGLPGSVREVTAGGRHTCAIDTDGGVHCWGNNGAGQLGDGTITDSLRPVPVSGLSRAISLAAGWAHTCALTSNHEMVCWGNGVFGQLGNGTREYRPTPGPVSGLTNDIIAIAAGFIQTCAVTAGGSLLCWGSHAIGGDLDPVQLVPVLIPLSTVASVAAGHEHTCALTTEGSAYCWGYNGDGRLGNGAGEAGPPRAVILPMLSTDAATDVTHMSATLHATIISEGGAPITSRGLCFDTAPDPGHLDNCLGPPFGSPAFAASLSGLSPSITYHVRAFVTNAQGTFFGNDVTFTTLPAPPCTGMQLGLGHYSITTGPFEKGIGVSVYPSPWGCAGSMSWTAAANDSWIIVSPASGVDMGSVYIYITPNRGAASRTGSATVAGFTIPVTQGPAPPRDPQRDFDADGWVDLLFRHADSGELVLWSMAGGIRVSSQMFDPPSANTNWRVAGTGDLVVWFMNGVTRTSYAYLSIPRPADPLWKVVAVADMNGDTKPDLVWQHSTSGAVAAWILDGTTVTSRVSLNPGTIADTNWKVVGTGDFNGDGRIDLLWKHATDGSLIVWLMDGVNRTAVQWLTPNRVIDNNWTVAAVADLDVDGRVDIVFQHALDGRLVVWLMEGVTRSMIALVMDPSRVADPRWRIVAPK
jgi:alpha-tubulin suppressor-like RCC1 family protein